MKKQLIVGPLGSGKTTLAEELIYDIKQDFVIISLINKDYAIVDYKWKTTTIGKFRHPQIKQALHYAIPNFKKSSTIYIDDAFLATFDGDLKWLFELLKDYSWIIVTNENAAKYYSYADEVFVFSGEQKPDRFSYQIFFKTAKKETRNPNKLLK